MRVAMFLNILNRLQIGGAQSGGGGGVARRERADVPALDAELTREEGEAGLIDRRLGKASGKRVPAGDRAEEVERLYRERYQAFTVKHFHEHLVKDHGLGWSYTWSKLHIQWAGVVAKAPRKEAHRRKRERRPLSGMMLHQSLPREGGGTARDMNGSRARGSRSTSLSTMDDATGSDLFGLSHRGGRCLIAGRKMGVLANALCQRTLRAGLPHVAGPIAQGTMARRDRHSRGGQRLHSRGLSARPQRPLRRPAKAWPSPPFRRRSR